MIYELKLATGQTARWEGASGEDAARRYADAHQATVVAWREPRAQLLVGGPQS
jgi:hypothetical protein